MATRYATDGSGGPGYVPSELKKCASAVAILGTARPRDSDLEVINAQVLASGVIVRQTVPRAELWAGIMASDAAVGNPASRETLSDSTYFVNGVVSENIDKLQEGKNGDLWEHWMQEMSCDQHVVCKVKARAEDDVLMGNMETRDYLGSSWFNLIT